MFRKIILGWAGLVFGGFVFAAHAQDYPKGGHGDVETDSYYSGIENYFRLTKSDLADNLGHGVEEEEVPVALFIARRAGLEPDAVWSVHDSGLTWMQVAWHFKLNPWIFFTPLPQKAAEKTPYEKAYGLYSSRADKVSLSDADLVNLVNLKFISEQYNCPPEEVARLRADGKSFREINDRYWGRKDIPRWDVDIPGMNPSPTPGQGPGTGHRGHHMRGGMGTGGGTPPSGGSDSN